jgi:hypothetical protein
VIAHVCAGVLALCACVSVCAVCLCALCVKWCLVCACASVSVTRVCVTQSHTVIHRHTQYHSHTVNVTLSGSTKLTLTDPAYFWDSAANGPTNVLCMLRGLLVLCVLQKSSALSSAVCGDV